MVHTPKIQVRSLLFYGFQSWQPFGQLNVDVTFRLTHSHVKKKNGRTPLTISAGKIPLASYSPTHQRCKTWFTALARVKSLQEVFLNHWNILRPSWVVGRRLEFSKKQTLWTTKKGEFGEIPPPFWKIRRESSKVLSLSFGKKAPGGKTGRWSFPFWDSFLLGDMGHEYPKNCPSVMVLWKSN